MSDTLNLYPRRVLRFPELLQAVGLGETCVKDMVRRGEFPRPIKLSKRAVGWRVEDVEAWLESRPETVAVG